MRTLREIAEELRESTWHFAQSSEVRRLAEAFLELLDERRGKPMAEITDRLEKCEMTAPCPAEGEWQEMRAPSLTAAEIAASALLGASGYPETRDGVVGYVFRWRRPKK